MYKLPGLLVALLGLTCICSTASAQAPKGKKEPLAKHVFGPTKLHEFHLEVSAKEWDRMQQVRGGMPFFGGPKKAPDKAPDRPGEAPLEFHKSSGFGTEFPWAHADLLTGAKAYRNVGLRYKGNGSYMSTSSSLKRNLRIDLDHYEEDMRFEGLKSITLNAGAMDAQRMREALAYSVFREAGVPAPRTAYAEVTLSVPGKFNKELVGLYTFVEHIDKSFLKDRFGNNKGLLMKPERMRGIEYLGEEWDKYKAKYQPKHEPTKKEAKRVIEFARLVHKSSDEQFHKEIGTYLDVDNFLRFLAVTALVGNQDSFFTIGHNYFIYLNPKTDKLVFIPWDLDLSFGGFPMGGSATQQMDMSLTHPYSGDNKMTDRLLANPKVREQYDKIVKELTTTSFAKEKLFREIEILEKTTKPSLAREKKAIDARKEGKGGFGFGGMFGASADLRTFVTKRHESALAQLAGTSKGYVPTMGFGFGGGGKGGPKGGFGPGNFFAKPLIAELDTDKDSKISKEELIAGAKRFFKEADKDKTGKLDEKALAEGLNRIFPQPPGFGGGGFAPKGGPGFGPGKQFAGALMKRADRDKDAKVTLDEFVAAAETLFKELDKDKKGLLDEPAVVAGINLLAPPPAFGPPPFGPADKKDEPKKK